MRSRGGRMTTTRPQVFFLCIPASVADGAAIDPKGIKTLLDNGLITFFIMAILFLVMHRVIYQEILLVVLS